MGERFQKIVYGKGKPRLLRAMSTEGQAGKVYSPFDRKSLEGFQPDGRQGKALTGECRVSRGQRQGMCQRHGRQDSWRRLVGDHSFLLEQVDDDTTVWNGGHDYIDFIH